jgi:tRNA threonylcarbamoyladenosine biosynthesis protein TsaE
VRRNQEPAGKSGRLSPFRFGSFALASTIGYAVGFAATAIAAALIIQEVQPLSLYPILLIYFAQASPLPGILHWGLCSVSGKFMRKLESQRLEVGISAGYLICVGIVCGAIAGTAVAGLMFIPSNAVREFGTPAVMFGGPLVGIWWVLRLKPGRVDTDYDDDMTLASKGPKGAITVDLPDLLATEAFGRRLAARLFPNAVIALVGPLGAGKTALSRAIAEGLGIANPAAVTSPTFTLIHEYPARLPIYHFDAYRLNGPAEFLDLGVTEYFEAGGVCLIEWADRVESALPDERLTIRIEPVDESRRRVEISAIGARYAELMKSLASGAA